ncbi:gamma-glutamyltransferase [Novosphingobium sp.]|uniref:gamma-glutamyltransferase n=1 Tax=Novosphingobium sp. TaxID=1874826 RepID=UPI0027371D40|nr:gamma-glutamyltransferase [Novosphingobium sp.]MDP3906304.1 gamma-glutamyltransferase [Novosphingobium sp.]
MKLKLVAILTAPLLLGACAGTSAPRLSAASPTFEHGMVSAADPRAAEAGAEILRAGGSAADAALATLLALTVVEPQSSGIGGGGFLIHDDGKGGVESFDGRETAPAAADGTWFYVDGKPLTVPQAIPGGRSVGVPGNIRMMAEAHRAHGKLPWSALFQPAIRLARDGFTVTPRLAAFLDRFKASAALTEAGRAIYYQPDGNPIPAGTTLKNPDLATFLEQVAAQGPNAFYTGANAQKIVDAVTLAPRNPAPMTMADVAGYKVKERTPVCTFYRAHKVCGMGPPSSGATTVQGVLGMVERFDLRGLGKDDPRGWHLIAEAMRLAYADRERYLADPDFFPVPTAGLLAPDYLAARSQLIAIDRTMPSVEAGNPKGVKVALADTLTPDVVSTSHFVAIDRAGRAATLTSTIESAFGSGLVVNGYFLNNELTDLSILPERGGRMVANKVEGGKRPRSSMAPTLVYAPDGKLRLAVGAAGGATIPAQVLKAIIAVIDWDMTAQDAIALPVIFAPGGQTVFVERGSPHEVMIPFLQALGHTDVQLRERSFKANAIEVKDGRLLGAADPRSEGVAVSE